MGISGVMTITPLPQLSPPASRLWLWSGPVCGKCVRRGWTFTTGKRRVLNQRFYSCTHSALWLVCIFTVRLEYRKVLLWYCISKDQIVTERLESHTWGAVVRFSKIWNLAESGWLSFNGWSLPWHSNNTLIENCFATHHPHIQIQKLATSFFNWKEPKTKL